MHSEISMNIIIGGFWIIDSRFGLEDVLYYKPCFVFTTCICSVWLSKNAVIEIIFQLQHGSMVRTMNYTQASAAERT